MKTKINIFFIILITLASTIPTPFYDPVGPATDSDHFENIAHYQTWHHLQLFKDTTTHGPIDFVGGRYAAAARSFVVASSCAYDAWASITEVTTVSGVKVKHSLSPTKQNIDEAIAYAYHAALLDVFTPLDRNFFPDKIDRIFLKDLDYPLHSSELSEAARVGIEACQHILDQRSHDRTNAHGTDPLSSGIPYSDTTGYIAPNDPMPFVGRTDCGQLRAGPGHWQPARAFKPPSGSVALLFGEAVFSRAKTWGLNSAAEFRSPPPFSVNTSSRGWHDQNEELVQISGNLNDARKVTAQYWQTGEVYGSSGFCMRVAMTALRIRKSNLEKSLTVYFMTSTAIYEALIAEYEGKRFYSPGRPTTGIQCQYEGQHIQAWAGPWQGAKTISASDWQAYVPRTLVTNPNPEYPCGHCCVTAAVEIILTNSFGKQFVGVDYVFPEGSAPLEPKITSKDNDPRFTPGITDTPNGGPDTTGYVPAHDVRLSWATWEDWAVQASNSRMWLGVHYAHSTVMGRKLGLKVGNRIWEKAQQLYSETK